MAESRTTINDDLARLSKSPGEAELKKVERLLARLAPQQLSGCAHLLNALLVEAERPQVREPVLTALCDALVAAVGGGDAGHTLQSKRLAKRFFRVAC
jgi:hypothetical protein